MDFIHLKGPCSWLRAGTIRRLKTKNYHTQTKILGLLFRNSLLSPTVVGYFLGYQPNFKNKNKKTDRKITLETDRPRNFWRKVALKHGTVHFAKSSSLPCVVDIAKGRYVRNLQMNINCDIRKGSGKSRSLFHFQRIHNRCNEWIIPPIWIRCASFCRFPSSL